jgi:hypothetical protein
MEATRTPATSSSMKWISQQEAMAPAKPASSLKAAPAVDRRTVSVHPPAKPQVALQAPIHQGTNVPRSPSSVKPPTPTVITKSVSRPPSTAYVATPKPPMPAANTPAERAYPFGNTPTTRQAASTYTPGVPVAKDQPTSTLASALTTRTTPSTYVTKDRATPPNPASTYRPAPVVQSAKLPSTVQQVAKAEPPKNTATLYDYPPPAPRRIVTPISTYQTQTVTAVSTPRPAAPPVVIFEEKPAMANHNAVTSGVVVVSNEDSPQAVPEVAAASLEDLLKQRVAMACGPAGRDLEVVLRSTTHVTVDLKASNRATAQQLSRKVLQLPELEPYRVSLKIQVEP